MTILARAAPSAKLMPSTLDYTQSSTWVGATETAQDVDIAHANATDIPAAIGALFVVHMPSSTFDVYRRLACRENQHLESPVKAVVSALERIVCIPHCCCPDLKLVFVYRRLQCHI